MAFSDVLLVGPAIACADLYFPAGGILTKKLSIHVSVYSRQTDTQTDRQTKQSKATRKYALLETYIFDWHPAKAKSLAFAKTSHERCAYTATPCNYFFV